MSNGQLNPNCTEPVNFAFIQTNGVPTGPPGPNTATNATFTPNAQTLLMNQGDHIRVTIKDTSAGLITFVDDLTTGKTGFMVASGANGFQNTDPNTCAGTNFDFHPEFDTAKFGNFVPWAALQANINFSMELGHFEIPDGDSDDQDCFSGPPLLVGGCIGEDLDFDGNSYQFDWPGTTFNTATAVQIGSAKGGGIGPLSFSNRTEEYDDAYPIMQFESEIPASEANCQPTGVGCVIPPVGARFYPYYALDRFNFFGVGPQNCTMVFGGFSGFGINNFGGDAQYGPPDLPWFFAQSSSGPVVNPCIPNTQGRD